MHLNDTTVAYKLRSSSFKGSADEKRGADTLLYKFRAKGDLRNINFNFTCVRNCNIEFVMVLANTTTGIEFTFSDSNNNTLGVQFPGDFD